MGHWEILTLTVTAVRWLRAVPPDGMTITRDAADLASGRKPLCEATRRHSRVRAGSAPIDGDAGRRQDLTLLGEGWLPATLRHGIAELLDLGF